ncbi:hypothetical protein [Zavarzinia sp. CC-PAN008]|uniref:hypothetical protein n=1 Tax=Zavarzinia sp. CC-PAN008 TaxID=3243332 RepID=UPI003F742177
MPFDVTMRERPGELFLWILAPVDARRHAWSGVPYRGPIVIRATSAAVARAIAATQFPRADAADDIFLSPWLSQEYTSCARMGETGTVHGAAGLVSPPIAIAMACYGEDLTASELNRFYQSVTARQAAYALMMRSPTHRPVVRPDIVTPGILIPDNENGPPGA